MSVQTVTANTKAPQKRSPVFHIYPLDGMVAYCGHTRQRKSPLSEPFDGPRPDDCVVCLELRKARFS